MVTRGSTTYQFYILPEHLYIFLSRLAEHFGPKTDSFHWEWPDGRSITHQNTEASNPNASSSPTPFLVDANHYPESQLITLMLPEDDSVRKILGRSSSLLKLTAPRWLRGVFASEPEPPVSSRSAAGAMRHELYGIQISFESSPLRLRWETGQPAYVQVNLDGFSFNHDNLFGDVAFNNLVAQLATEVRIQAGIYDLGGDHYPRVLDNRVLDPQGMDFPVPIIYCTPNRLRKVVAAIGLGAFYGGKTTRQVFSFFQAVPLSSLNEIAIDALRPWLRHENVQVRRLAAGRLSDCENILAEDVASLLNDPSPRVRQMVCEAVCDAWHQGNLEEDNGIVAQLVEFLRDPDPGVRIMAGRALVAWDIYWSKAIELLESDDHPQVQASMKDLRERNLWYG